MTGFSHLQITVEPTQQFTEDQRLALAQMIDLAFAAEWGPLPEDTEPIHWAQPAIHVIGWLEGCPVSHAGILPRAVMAGGKSLRVGGIGSVCTHPDHLRRGYAHRLMEAAHRHIRQANLAEFAMLFCAQKTTSLYQEFGYQVVESPLWMEQPNSRRLFDSPKMVLPLADFPWPDGEIDIQGLPW